MGEGEGINDEVGDQRGLRRQSKAQAENNANESVARVRASFVAVAESGGGGGGGVAHE